MVSVLPAPPESLNAAAPAPLRILLDAIDRLGRLDGWIGGGCLLTLTALMLAEVAHAFAVEFPAVLSADHLDRLGVFLLSDGGLLHLRRGHDAACRRPYPCRAAAEERTGAGPARARDPLGVRRLRCSWRS